MTHRWPLLVLLLLLCACNMQFGGGPKGKKKDAKKKKKVQEVIPVRVAPLRIGRISRTLSGSGTLRGKGEVDVLTEVGGLVTELLCDKGRMVTKGQVLAKLEAELQQVDLDNAKVGLEEAQAKQTKVRYTLNEQDHVIERSRLKLQDAKVALIKAQLAFSESKRALASKLKLPKGSLSQDELEKVRLSRDQAEQEVARGKLTVQQSGLDLKSAELKKGDLKQDLRDAGRQVKKARLTVTKAQIELARRSIRAPISGLVYDRQLEPGQRIGASVKVFSIVDQSRFYLDLRVPEAELALLAVGQQVSITAPLLFSAVRGRVSQLDPSIDPKTGTVGVRIQVPDEDHQTGPLGFVIPADFMLRRGMFVRAKIEVQTHPRAKLIPHEALGYKDEEAFVFTVVGGKARRVAVRTGFAREGQLEIICKRLDEGAPIVVVGQRTVKDGTPVRTIK